MDRDTYDKMAVLHMQKDIKVGWKELENAQKTVRSHGCSMTMIFGLGDREECCLMLPEHEFMV